MDLKKRKTNANLTVMMIRIVEYQEAANKKNLSCTKIKRKKARKKKRTSPCQIKKKQNEVQSPNYNCSCPWFSKILITLIGPLTLNVAPDTVKKSAHKQTQTQFLSGCCFTPSHLFGINCTLGQTTTLPFSIAINTIVALGPLRVPLPCQIWTYLTFSSHQRSLSLIKRDYILAFIFFWCFYFFFLYCLSHRHSARCQKVKCVWCHHIAGLAATATTKTMKTIWTENTKKSK